jgi:FAD/FMN-containing dehydrogenase
MLITNRPEADAEALRARLDGAVAGPADAGWDRARKAWNLAVDQRPAAVAFPVTDNDVAETIRFAAERGLRVAPQTTGHGAAPLARDLEDAILLNTSRMRGVRIDRPNRIARVRAGAQWGDVTLPASAYGLAPLAGSSPSVGVVGYTVGGGLSWLARKHGLACNSATAFEVAIPEHGIVRADADHNPELFWALRGGGGSFGVVTALEFELYEVEDVYAGTMLWPWEQAEEVLHAYRYFSRTVPDEVTSLCRLLQLPDAPSVPSQLRGGKFIAFEAAITGHEAYRRDIVEPMRAFRPVLDLFATMPAAGLVEIHSDPRQPVAAMGNHRLLENVGDGAIDTLLEVAGPGSRSPLLSVELRQLGGALARPGTGALAKLDGEFSLFAVGQVTSAEAAMAIDASLAELLDAMAPWDAGTGYLNFVENRDHARRFFDRQTYNRLRAVKEAVDPDHTILANHPV